MILSVLPLLLACIVQAQDPAPLENTPAAQVIEQLCGDWRAKRITTIAQLEAGLSGLHRDATPELCQLLESAPTDVPLRPFAMASAKLGGSRSLPALLTLAGSPRAEHRIASVTSLGFIGTDTALPALVSALDDTDAAVVAAAEKSIQSAKCPPAVVARSLSEGISRGKDKCRAARLLGKLGTDHAHQALLDHADSAAEAECVAALQGLWIGARVEDGAHLLELLKRSKIAGARKQTCLVLGRLKHKPAIDDLIVCLRDADPGVRANAHWALKQITDLPLKQDAELWELWKRRMGETKTPPAD